MWITATGNGLPRQQALVDLASMSDFRSSFFLTLLVGETFVRGLALHSRGVWQFKIQNWPTSDVAEHLGSPLGQF